MVNIVSSPDTLDQRLLAQRAAPQAALCALQRVHELEREVMALRGALSDLSEQGRQDTAWQNQVANLLSKIILFRVALGELPGHGALASDQVREE